MKIKHLLLNLSFAASLIAQDTAGVGSVTGTVKNSQGEAAASVRVCVQSTAPSSQARCAATDAKGVFHITEVRAGTYQLEVTAPNQKPVLSAEVNVRAGLEGRVDIALPALDALQQSVTVSESLFVAPEEVKTSSFLVQRYEIFKAAGAQQDVSRYVQTLPGVGIGTNDFRNDLIVRGGSPLENLFVVDNVEIPNINNFANFASAGGTTSILDADLIRDVNFMSGGYPAPFINRTSSVLQIAQREGSREAFSGRVSLGSAGLGAILEGPLKGKRGSWVFSGKRSFLDAFTKDVGFGGVPVNYNYNTKVLYDFGPRDRVWLVNFTAIDNIRLGLTDKKKDDDPDRNPELDFLDIRYKGWRSATGFNWQRLLGERGVGLLGVTHSEANVNQSTKDLLKFGRPGSSVSDLIANTPFLFQENNREGESTIKYDLTTYLPVFDKIQAGGSFKIFRIRYNTRQPFGNDNPYSPIQNLNPFFLARSFVANQTGAYVQSSKNLGARLNLTWGGRLDNFQILGQTKFSPRVGLSYQLTSKLSLRGSYGTYYQQPQFLFVEAFPQNRGLSPIRANHYVAGISYILSPTLRFTVETYRKDYANYPVATQFPSFSLANSGDTFAVTDILLPYASAGRGRVRGLEFFIEKKFSARWYGQTNVAFSRTRHAGLDGVLRPGTYDYPVIFNAVGGYKLRKTWDVSARFVYLSGKPFTPFNEPLSRSQNRGIFDLTRVNALRAPDYFRLDLRVDKTFTVRGKPLLVFFGAQNATNRRNIAQVDWDRRANATRLNRQLGLFPNIGLDWRF
ncbi:MAG: TonB-dependent receptor [Bryobacteraceae bacterium]|nr:TonB-dependent receptor [Bryobacteraceae bacterium]